MCPFHWGLVPEHLKKRLQKYFGMQANQRKGNVAYISTVNAALDSVGFAHREAID